MLTAFVSWSCVRKSNSTITAYQTVGFYQLHSHTIKLKTINNISLILNDLFRLQDNNNEVRKTTKGKTIKN